MKFEQDFTGIFLQLLHVLIDEGFLVTNDLFELSILGIHFQLDSSYDSLKTMAEL